MRPKQWRFAPPAPPTFFTAFPDLPWPLAQTLFNRGYTDPASARAFLNSDGLDTNPFAMRGMQEAVRRLRDAIRRNEPIAVYGDYDVDGVTATALWSTPCTRWALRSSRTSPIASKRAMASTKTRWKSWPKMALRWSSP